MKKDTKKTIDSGRLVPKPGTAELRLYNVGLGDCFLLAFPRPDGSTCYFVIDCGIAKNTPDERDRMKRIVQDIIDSTGGEIDILAVTHEHYDHVSGFSHAKDLWVSLKVGSVWLPWIEKDGESEADDVRGMVDKLNSAAQKAIEQGLFTPDAAAGLKMESGFLGVDMLGAGDFGAKSVMNEAYAVAKGRVATPDFFEPGDVRMLPGTQVAAYVLGPPRHRDRMGNELKKGNKFFLKLLEDEEEMYSYHDIGMTPDGGKKPARLAMTLDGNDDALAGAILGSDDDDFDRYCPFDSRYRRPWEEAMLEPFFVDHYSGNQTYRRVDNDWLAGSADLALRAGDYTNNISLVLAFEMPISKRILLFPGDAQVGNWLSWHAINEWKGDVGNTKLTAEALLNRVLFYKAGHHGSHNATVREKGLEMMAKAADGTDLELVSYVPVSVPVAHDVMSYCPMPFYPIMKRLQERTRGELYLGNGRKIEPSLNVAPVQNPQVTVSLSTATQPAMVKKGITLEEEYPLFMQFTIEDR